VLPNYNKWVDSIEEELSIYSSLLGVLLIIIPTGWKLLSQESSAGTNRQII